MSGPDNWAGKILVHMIVAGHILFRIFAFGDLRLSMATADTDSYLGASRGTISRLSLTGPRPLTTNLLFKLKSDEDCRVLSYSAPAIGREINRSLQTCFAAIAVLQNILSITGWTLLACVVINHLTGLYAKLMTAFLIPAFGFSPPLADWDSILGSESLTFSLFAVAFACLIEICFQATEINQKNLKKNLLLFIGLLILALWAFTRDTNVYALLILLLLALPLLKNGEFRAQTQLRTWMFVLGLIIVLNLQTAAASKRWVAPLTNVFNDFILPHPARVDFMKAFGMPEPKSAAYQKWFQKSAPLAYGGFLVSHPGYVSQTLISDLDILFVDNLQPYFQEDNSFNRILVLDLGNLMHPPTHLILGLDVLLLITVLVAAKNQKSQMHFIWAWLGSWLFLSASASLFFSYFADSIGLARHTLFSIELFRLMFWIFFVYLIDLATSNRAEG